jgi:alkaline phosphatase D
MHRRAFLAQLAALPVLAPALPVLGRGAGQVTPDRRRPIVTAGVQSGDVTDTAAVVWSRADRAARMHVEYALNESFGDAVSAPPVAAIEDTDYTARIDLVGLPPGARVFYRVRFESLAWPGAFSEPVTGSFGTAPRDRRPVRLAWSADTAGQGWGIDEARGGYRTYATMLRHRPDVFINAGDAVYADGPLMPTVTLEDGFVWTNIVTPSKSKVAETLAEFRGNFAYNLLDGPMRAFNAHVPSISTWDDHETRNNWYPAQRLDDARYVEQSVSLLAARARRAFAEYTPTRVDGGDPDRLYRAFRYGPLLDLFVLDTRSYRGANSSNRQPQLDDRSAMLGPAQLAWLQRELRASRATWKVIVNSIPIGLVVSDGMRSGEPAHEGWANGDGPPLGRELELRALFSGMKRDAVRNVVWITGDVHYAAAHHYDPGRARFTDFVPFWEFVAGPLHAGTFGPNVLDPTFGPEVRYASSPVGMRVNRPPSDGEQFFGLLDVEPRGGRLTVSIRDVEDRLRWSTELEPEPASR